MKKKSVFMGMGVPSLLMMFIILCMIILALLSFENANQSEALAQREIQELEHYYEGEATTEMLLHSISNQDFETLDEMSLTLLEEAKNIGKVITTEIEHDILNLNITIDDNYIFHVQLDQEARKLTWGKKKGG